MHEFTITKENSGQRLDKYVSRLLPLAPRSFLYKAFRNKDIRLNGRKAEGSELLGENDRIQLRFGEAQYLSLGGRNAQTETDESEAKSITGRHPGSALPACYGRILYEDENLILVDKKSGVLSQRAKPEDRSINEALLDYCGGKTPLFTPSVCNRLDRNTSGILIFAKTYRGAKEAADLLKQRQAHKFYLAAVYGNITEKEQRKAKLSKDGSENRVRILKEDAEEGSLIETAWEPVASGKVNGKAVTLLKVELLTGKTHQIRAQLASIGHPVLGDRKYGMPAGKKANETEKESAAAPVRRLMLHSYELTLPERGTFRTELPKEFTRMFPGLEAAMEKNGAEH